MASISEYTKCIQVSIKYMQEGLEIGQFKSKSGKTVMVRTIKNDDTAILMEFMNTLSKEDTYLLVSGEEFTHTEEERFVRNIVDHMLADNYIYLLAFINNKLAATVSVRRMIENRRRTLHVGEIGLMVARDFRDDGIGSIMLKCVLEKVREMGNIKLLRLWVFGPNEKAKKLYEKFGFGQCGSIPKGVLYKDDYISHDLMFLELNIP